MGVITVRMRFWSRVISMPRPPTVEELIVVHLVDVAALDLLEHRHEGLEARVGRLVLIGGGRRLQQHEHDHHAHPQQFSTAHPALLRGIIRVRSKQRNDPQAASPAHYTDSRAANQLRQLDARCRILDAVCSFHAIVHVIVHPIDSGLPPLVLDLLLPAPTPPFTYSFTPPIPSLLLSSSSLPTADFLSPYSASTAHRPPTTAHPTAVVPAPTPLAIACRRRYDNGGSQSQPVQ